MICKTYFRGLGFLMFLLSLMLPIAVREALAAQATPDAPESDPSPHTWHPGFAVPGLDGPVNTLTSWRGQLIAGGSFEFADGERAPGLAAWNGVGWTAIDSTRTGEVIATAVWRDRLVVARYRHFTYTDIAVWDGESWEDLPALTGRVYDMLADEDTLLVGGSTTPPLASHVHSGWGTVLPLTNLDGPILAVARHGRSIAFAGAFNQATRLTLNGVGEWDGREVRPLGSGVVYTPGSSGIRTLAVVGGKLTLGGSFRLQGSMSPTAIAQMDAGRWTSLGGGFAWVDRLWSEGDDLWAVGLAASDTTVRIARMHDGVWTDLTPAGGRLAIRPDDRWNTHLSVAVHDSSIFVGGDFYASQGTGISNVAALLGNAWAPLAGSRGLGVSGGGVYSLTPWTGGLLAIGQFRTAGTAAAINFASFDGQSWTAVGPTLPGGVSGGVETRDGLVVRTWHSGTFAHRLSLQSDGRWIDLTPGLNPARDVDQVGSYRGELVALGHFRLPGRIDTTLVAIRQDGRWRPLADEDWRDVPQLVEVDGELVVWGQRKSAPSSAPELLRFTEGGWTEYLPAPPRIPFRIIRWGARTVAACHYTDWNGQYPTDSGAVYLWDDSRWIQLGPDETWITDIEAFADSLVIAAVHVKKWDGHEWLPMAGAPDALGSPPDRCEALAVVDDQLWVGGEFAYAGGHAASNIACYGAVPTLNTDRGISLVARPNSFDAATGIIFDSPVPENSIVTVHGADGRRLRVLWDGPSGPGRRTVWWDGRDGNGRDLPSGTYWIHATTPSREGAIRIVHVR